LTVRRVQAPATDPRNESFDPFPGPWLPTPQALPPCPSALQGAGARALEAEFSQTGWTWLHDETMPKKQLENGPSLTSYLPNSMADIVSGPYTPSTARFGRGSRILWKRCTFATASAVFFP